MQQSASPNHVRMANEVASEKSCEPTGIASLPYHRSASALAIEQQCTASHTPFVAENVFYRKIVTRPLEFPPATMMRSVLGWKARRLTTAVRASPETL
jgi:hypothetical protein